MEDIMVLKWIGFPLIVLAGILYSLADHLYMSFERFGVQKDLKSSYFCMFSFYVIDTLILIWFFYWMYKGIMCDCA